MLLPISIEEESNEDLRARHRLGSHVRERSARARRRAAVLPRLLRLRETRRCTRRRCG
jgi:hypothetical protein